MDERVQKLLSQWGIASRRQAEQMILAGRVQLNGTIAQLGQKANPAIDHIAVDGVFIQPAQRPTSTYLLLNKPAGVLSTCTDPWQRPTVLDLLPASLKERHGMHPVGRLDADSTGALLLTNDGALTFYLTHPRHHIPKTYEVWVEGYPSASVLQQWQQGVMLSGCLTLPTKVSVLEQSPHRKTLLKVILTEGRNRQIRRVAEQLGHPVLQLHRTAIGSIQLEARGAAILPSGQYRPLKDLEISFLNAQLDLPSSREPVTREEYSR
ncbi:pseudouridine synthase [Stenomitos frigidus]|uniref:Pseudouridine synthase n=1 Tax=Stenomitos frigidus ULC18 TaxID=2107698 RepID=A0A2T1E4W4_9CYAN|nr:pseudouridine synthase [Stenomitos frigidus]PSB27766.1 pseudouridine synthase [Stenomitos frigidus ULC18]